jgi:hypothetical protein
MKNMKCFRKPYFPRNSVQILANHIADTRETFYRRRLNSQGNVWTMQDKTRLLGAPVFFYAVLSAYH